MWKHIVSNALTLFIVLAVVLLGLLGSLQSKYTAQGPLTAPIFFEVKRGDTLGRVSDRLQESGAIGSAASFRISARMNNHGAGLKFGSYELPAGASYKELLDIISSGGPSVVRYSVNLVIRNQSSEIRVRERVPGGGDPIDIATFNPEEGIDETYAQMVSEGIPFTYRVTAAPGLTVWQVAQGLQQADFLVGQIANMPSEGMMAPNTYDVARGSERQDLVDRMVAAQQRNIASVWAERVEGLPIRSEAEMMALASIIEKETSVPDERGLVASVFVNRLNRGMKLQTDPTVIYGVTKGRGVLGRGIRRSELRARTDYNTYVIEGLPPTPIANPGLAAMRAAVNPDASDYIFFVADGTGGHAFAESLAEHNANVAKWRQIERDRKRTAE